MEGRRARASAALGKAQTRPVDINKVSKGWTYFGSDAATSQMKNAETADQCKYIHDVGWPERPRGCARLHISIHVCVYVYGGVL